MSTSLQIDRVRELSPLETLLDAVAAGRHVAVHGEPCSRTGSLLDRAAAELPGASTRVVRTGGSRPGGLGLADLVNRVVQQWPAEVGGDDRLERAFLTLTVPGAGYRQIALLIDDAQELAPAALQYLKLTCQSGPPLRIVLAGPPALKDKLAEPEFRWLRDRIACELDLSAPSVPEPTSPTAQTERHVVAAPRAKPSRAPVRVGLGLAVAASVLVAVWAVRREAGPGSTEPVAAAIPPAPAAFAAAPVAVSEPAPEQPPDAGPVLAAFTPAAPAATAGSPPGEAAAWVVPEPAIGTEPDTPAVPRPRDVAAAQAPVPAAAPAGETLTAAAAVLAPEPASPPPAIPPAATQLVESTAVPAAPMAQLPEVPLAPVEIPSVVHEANPAPPAVTIVPVLARSLGSGGWPPERAGAGRAPAMTQARPEKSVAPAAAQRCRAIVVKAQLGEEPSDADRDFLRRGCPAER